MTTPNRAATITDANSSGDCRRDWYFAMSEPMPGVPRWKKKSPTIAPTTERPAEMRMPAKIAGVAVGNSSLARIVQRDGALQLEQFALRPVDRLQAEQGVRRPSGRAR